MTRKHGNNCTTSLNGSITDSATTLTVSSAAGFPTLGAGDTFRLTLVQGSTIEIVEVTDASGSPTFTVTRGMEGTIPVAWTNGSIVSLRLTAASIDSKLDTTSFTDALISISDITTNNVSTTKHGFVPKAPNDATKYLDGTGTWSTPAGGGSGGITWNTASGTTQAASVNNGYICTNASQCNITLPATAVVGSIIAVVSQGAGGIKITANTGQTIKGLGDTTTTAGNITCAAQYDAIEVVCIVANTTWAVRNFTSSLLTFS